MALVDLLTDLSNFNWNYESAGVNNSQINDRHGGQSPDIIHPEEHSKFDDGVGFGVAPNDNPQTFDVRGYTITGTKTFDRPNQEAITIMTNRLGFPYTPSDFQTTPIEAYSSIFATQDGLIMDTIYDSGFNRGDMYIKDHLHQPHPEFKEFSRTDTSLKRIKLDSPNFDSDGNEKFTFKDRIPYNIPARDNNVIGFDQPFILKDIGDRWGPGKLGAIDEGLFRGGFVTSAARTVADVLRIGKFLLTPKGIMFGLKQFGLQLLNPRKETTIWNPLSLIGSVAPMVHMDRHFGTFTEGFGYESVINFGLASVGFRPNSILYGYGLSVNLPEGNIPAIAAVTATRVTGAHIVGMVPSAGGVPGTFPSIPEIDIDLSGGNITSLTIGTNKYGPKTLLGNKEYTISDGTPIIPQTVPEAGSWIIKDIIDATSEMGESISKTLTDAVLKPDIFQGHFTKQGEMGANEPGTYSSLFRVLEKPYTSLFGVTEQSIGEIVFVGKSGVVDGKPAVMPFLSYNVKPSAIIQPVVSIENLLKHKDDRGALQGFNLGSGLVYDPLNKDYPAELQIREEGIFLGDLYNKDDRYGEGYQYTIDQSPLYIMGGTDSDYDGLAQAKVKQVYKVTSDKVTPGTDKIYKLRPSILEEGISFGGLSMGDRIFNGSFVGDLYDKDKTYGSQISSLVTVSSPPEKTRLRIDGTTGDPIVTIKTSHPESDPNVVRLNAEGKYPDLKDIKLQDFPLINLQSSGNLGSEKQSLGFVNGTDRGLFGNLFGNETRFGHGQLKSDYSTLVPIKGTGFLQSSSSLSKTEESVPELTTILPYNHKFAPDGVQGTLEISNTEGFKTTKTTTNLGPDFSTKTTGFTNQTGNILDRYKTLAYGEIPTTNELDKRYSKKIIVRQLADKKEYEHYDAKEGDTTGGSSAVVVIDPELGLIKKTAVKSGAYTTDLVDKVNMHQYQDNDVGKTDSIKFKFKDIVNSKYIIFKAYLSGISETLSPEWSSEKYIGRPDSVHVYQGVERSISFEFMVVPNTKQELPILWEKMNYLVGLTYPSWRSVGITGKRMEAPFINLTIGDMYVDTPGFLSSLSITVDDNSPWELDEGFQLPHAISVSCEFTHIGKHALASQGKHYDLPFLRNYNQESGKLGTREGSKENGFILHNLMGDDGKAVVKTSGWTI